MGGDIKEFRFFVPDDFRTVQWRSADKTYERAPPSGDTESPLTILEVWGCGGKSADAAKTRARKYAAEAKREELRRLGKAVLYGPGGEELREAGGIGVTSADVKGRAGLDGHGPDP